MRFTSDNVFSRILFVCLLAAALSASDSAQAQNSQILKKMKMYEGKYHKVYYDIPEDQAREVVLRMEAMVEEYRQRTRDFAGTLNAKLPFLLFKKEEDYLNAGGLPKTAGVFTGDQLLAIAGEKVDLQTWHVVQHEGFHQFARSVIGPTLPIWLNEGLAEYFGEAIYTGDGYISGVVPAFRRERIRKEMDGGDFKSVDTMLNLSHAEWNDEMSFTNYDQAWSMVMFLAHGDNGKYQKAFVQYIRYTSQGIPSPDAWKKSFGSGSGFEIAWKTWWRSEDRDNEVEPFVQAGVQMLTSYMARAELDKQKFTSIDELTSAIENNKIKPSKSDPLPDGLAKDCIDLYKSLKTKRKCTFSLKALPMGQSQKLTQIEVVCDMPDGTTVIGYHRLKNGTRIDSVSSKIVKAGATTKPSK